MFMFLGVLSFLGFIVFPIMAIVSLFTKSGKAKRNFIIAGISFLIFAVAAFSDDSPEITKEAEQEETHIEKETNQKEIDAEKEAKQKEEAAKEKAEKEAKQKEKETKEKAEKKATQKKKQLRKLI